MPRVGQGLQAGSSHPEGAPVGSGSHQACFPPASLLQTRKIQALEELVETLEEHQGKRLSLQAGQLSLAPSLGSLHLPWGW